MNEFDFGPISRTVDASTGKGDAINLASLSVHEALTALLAGNNRDEFIAWLWHDLFKPLFWWPQKNKWFHYPNNKPNDPLSVEAHWSSVTGIPSGLVKTHHYRDNRAFTYGESETVNNEFDQVAIGKDARFVQLSFLAEPATHTALLRAVIADAFMEVVTRVVADSIEKELATRSPTFKRVRYVFDFRRVALSNPPENLEIASLANQYTLHVTAGELVVRHLMPLSRPDLDGHHVEVVIDFTAEPPTGERFGEGIISLVELLTVYQDSRTILMGIPQFLQVDIGQIEQQVKNAAEQRLRDLDIRTLASINELKKQSTTQGRVDWAALPLRQHGQDIDLLAHMFAEQVEIRLIDRGQLTQKVKDAKGKSFDIRLLNEIVSHPIALLAGKPRHCRFCNTAFESALPPVEAKVGNYFTDIEYIGFGGDICPMCRVYVLNSHKSRTASEKVKGVTGDRKAYRGALALITPSSHFTYVEGQCKLIEQPPLDVGGRFANPLQRATVTLQEYGLFNMISRRVIARMWAQIDDAIKPLPLPYMGAILLTQNEAAQIRTLFDCLETLFDQAELVAYPFKVTVQPAVELAFEMPVNDLKEHHTKHTYLKTSPTIVSVDPDSKFTLLVDNGLQLEVSRKFFEDRRRMNELLEGIKGQKRQHNWLLAVLQGIDPVTATAEAFYDYDAPLLQAEKVFWDMQLDAASLAEQWQRYEKVRGEVSRIAARYPMLIEFFAKPRR
ncbi:MAG TPA: hypothetical protein ENN99_04305 [Chloroflexi bacterium]|nr:hypothetical protein [Chloroflexota bacterium]